MGPREGDVLVSRPTAMIEHEISIVPKQPHIACTTHHTAIARACDLASALQVDAWLTEDHIHFLQIAACRTAGVR